MMPCGRQVFQHQCKAQTNWEFPFISPSPEQKLKRAKFLPVEPICWFAVVGSFHPAKYITVNKTTDKTDAYLIRVKYVSTQFKPGKSVLIFRN